MPKQQTPARSCPSSTCEPGAVLLGKVKKDGTLGLLPQGIMLDEAAAAAFEQLGQPERYYRFSTRCAENGCKQWDNLTGNCTVIKRVLAAAPAMETGAVLQACFIRDSCRWFAQDGPAACGICPLVITDHAAARL